MAAPGLTEAEHDALVRLWAGGPPSRTVSEEMKEHLRARGWMDPYSYALTDEGRDMLRIPRKPKKVSIEAVMEKLIERLQSIAILAVEAQQLDSAEDLGEALNDIRDDLKVADDLVGDLYDAEGK